VIAQVDDPGAWQYPDAARAEGIATSCTVPLLIDGTPIGILRVYGAERRAFSRRDVEFLEALGDLSALAIKNAQRHKAIRDDFAFIQEYTFGIHPTDR
jgi:GAF domain-containing protein